MPSSSATAASCSYWTGLDGAEPGPVPCGLLWYTHVGKTGGETVKRHLEYRSKAQKWGFRDLQMSSDPPSLFLPYRWEMTKTVNSLLTALNKTRPRIIVHQHQGYGGVGAHQIDRWFRPLATRFRSGGRNESDCRVVLVTTMREPSSRAISHAYQAGKYGQKGHHDDAVFEAFAREQANFQTKYALFGDDWRVKALRVADDAFDATLLPSALATLSYYDLVGRTEEMQAFRDAIDARMGWPLLDATVKHTSNSWAISGGGGRLPPTARALEDARRYNAIDAQLYRSFCRRNGTRNGNGGHHRRVVQPLWAAQPYQFPHYWTDVSHNDSKVKYTCAQNVGLCKWTLLPAHDSRACRAGSAETSPPEAWVTCDAEGMASSTLEPYQRNKRAKYWPKDAKGRPITPEEGAYSLLPGSESARHLE